MKNVTVNISMPLQLLEMIDESSKKELRNRSETIRKALRLYIETGGEKGLWNRFEEVEGRLLKLEHPKGD